MKKCRGNPSSCVCHHCPFCWPAGLCTFLSVPWSYVSSRLSVCLSVCLSVPPVHNWLRSSVRWSGSDLICWPSVQTSPGQNIYSSPDDPNSFLGLVVWEDFIGPTAQLLALMITLQINYSVVCVSVCVVTSSIFLSFTWIFPPRCFTSLTDSIMSNATWHRLRACHVFLSGKPLTAMYLSPTVSTC